MDESVARAYEAVAARRLREHMRYGVTTIQAGVRTASFSAPTWMIRDFVDAIAHSDLVRADAHLGEYRPDSPLMERPTTPGPRRWRGWSLRRKINLPRETLD